MKPYQCRDFFEAKKMPDFAFADWLDERGFAEYGAHVRRYIDCHLPVPNEINNWDWDEAFKYSRMCYEEPEEGFRHPSSKLLREQGLRTCRGSDAPAEPFGREDVRSVLAASEGQNDGDDWVACGELWDGRWFDLRAWCDYTGWG